MFDAPLNDLELGIRSDNGAEWAGLLDDFAIWDEALSFTEVAALGNLGRHAINFNASQADALFELFDTGSGSAVVGSWEWINVTGLVGAPGEVVLLPSNRYGLVLDAAGNGVATTPEPATLLVWSLLAALGVALGWRRRER